MELVIFGKNYEVDTTNGGEILEHFSLVIESLENEFAIDKDRTPYIDLTSVHFSQQQLDISDYLFSLSTLDTSAGACDRVNDIAIETREAKNFNDRITCEYFKLRPHIIETARRELSRVVETILSNFPELGTIRN